MADEIEELARLLGAKIVGQVPDAGGGVLGAAHLAKVYQARMTEIQAAPARTPKGEGVLLEIPISEAAAQALAELAAVVSKPGRRRSPGEIARALLQAAALSWAEKIRRAQTEMEEARKRHAEAEEQFAETERALWKTLYELSGVSDRQAAG
jgi:hypothetical protein